MSLLPPRYQPKRQRGERGHGDDVRERRCPCLKLGNRKINPPSILKVKDHNGYRKTTETKTRAEVILDMKRAPNTDRQTTSNENTEGNPKARCRPLKTQALKQRDELPATQSEKDDDDENAHARIAVRRCVARAFGTMGNLQALMVLAEGVMRRCGPDLKTPWSPGAAVAPSRARV